MGEKKAWAIDSANTILEQLSKHLKNSVSVPNALKEIINMYKLGKKTQKLSMDEFLCCHFRFPLS